MASPITDPHNCIGSHDILFVTLDSLRYDVAVSALKAGQTPNLSKVLPEGQWELRHSPGSFTYAAHQAFFAGFLPTPALPGPHERLFAAKFPGSETTGNRTCVFDAPDIVTGFAEMGYHTVCIGGVGFFNQRSPLGSALPNLFDESHWEERFGVSEYQSTRHQVERACEVIGRTALNQRLFLFLNVSATHQPHCMYVEGAAEDSTQTQAAALAYVDEQLAPLLQLLSERGPTLCVITSDHGTAYGEDGYHGHRLSHPVVMNVPYADFVL